MLFFAVLFSVYLFCYYYKEQMNRLLYIIFVLVCVLLGQSCVSTVKIASVVEKNNEGDFLLKWEVSPDQEGNIDIYSAMTDESYSVFELVKRADIAEKMTIINPAGSGLREFFILRTSGVTSGIVANRSIDMNRIKNFRDLGGYYTTENQQLRWGKLFRSGDLTMATLYDHERIRRLNIKTIIDFRSEKSKKTYPILVHPSIKVISLPIEMMDPNKLSDLLKEQNFDRSAAIRYVQDAYVAIAETYKSQFKEMFNIMSVEGNYPILLTASLGKDRVGIASFFILHALGVSSDDVLDDYLYSQKEMDIASLAKGAQKLPESLQEAITAMLSVDRAYLNFLEEYLVKQYGSVDKFMEKELDLTSGKRGVLKKYLLYTF